MPKTITVKGVGRVSTPPDCIVINMNLETRHIEYDTAMKIAADNIARLQSALEQIGFEPRALKTVNFQVRTDYDNIKDRHDRYQRVFVGYCVYHRLKIEFDFDTRRLAKTLFAISSCGVQPELSIAFTVKDPTAVSAELLRSATQNAREKAEVLCEAAQVKLGALIAIDYNWGELDVVSHTRYNLDEPCRVMGCASVADIDIEPDDIRVDDTAPCIWEIQ